MKARARASQAVATARLSLAADRALGLGVTCDAGCRVFDLNGVVADDLFVAGDVARFPQPIFGAEFPAMEHWGNAVEQAALAAHNMITGQPRRRRRPCPPRRHQPRAFAWMIFRSTRGSWMRERLLSTV